MPEMHFFCVIDYLKIWLVALYHELEERVYYSHSHWKAVRKLRLIEATIDCLKLIWR